MKKFLIPLFTIPFLVITSHKEVLSDTFTNEFARCIINESSPREKVTFIKWTLRLQAEHPDIKNMINLSEKEKLDLDKELGDVFTNLVQVRCIDEAKKAIRYEGYERMVKAFGLLGGASSRVIMSHPDVMEKSFNFNKHIDFSGLGVED